MDHEGEHLWINQEHLAQQELHPKISYHLHHINTYNQFYSPIASADRRSQWTHNPEPLGSEVVGHLAEDVG